MSKILIIFEVKKKLTPKEINKAVTHLSSITSKCTKNFVAQTDSKRMVPDLSIVKNSTLTLLLKPLLATIKIYIA